MNEREHKKLIGERKKTSLFWQLIHFFGSLNLAMFLLTTIAIACITATLMESGFNSRVAQHYIYKAPWFIVWLSMLCINLACAALTRYPWLPKHRGFVITHGGIIILLLGAVAGQKLGFEGFVTLHKGQPPVNRLVINRTMLQVQPGAVGDQYLLPVNLEVSRPTPEKPRRIRLPEGEAVILIERYAEELVTDEVPRQAASGAGVPALSLVFTSGMMGQEHPISIFLDSDRVHRDFFGLAEVEFVRDLGEAQIVESRENATHETQMVFAMSPTQPVVVPHGEGGATGVALLFEELAEPAATGEAKYRLSAKFPDGTSLVRPVEQVLGTTIEQGPYRLEVKQFWRNFTMNGSTPTEGEATGKNPALMVGVSGPAADAHSRPTLRLALVGDGRIAYELSRRGEVYLKGEAAEGEEIRTGWADWVANVSGVFASAERSTAYREIPPGKSLGPSQSQGAPGILVRVEDGGGQKSEATWILSGRNGNLVVGGTEVGVGFGLETRPVNFSVNLTNFEVPRDEGTDTPANFISTIEFKDLQSGESKEAVSKMNHPASYPGGFWRLLTGVNYKFSQASWNPEDLGETTLQVLYDPGWMLKWIGSLMICAGITVMFYLKPRQPKRVTT